MKNKFPLLILSLVLLCLLGNFEQVSACSCVRTSSCQAYNNADVVFVGKVIGSKYQKTVKDNSNNYQNSNSNSSVEPQTITYDVGEIYFQIEESFVGVEKGSQVTIHSNTGGGDCGYWFERGKTYLVYARKENSTAPGTVSSLTYSGSDNKEELKPDAKRLWTSICSRTAPIEFAEEDLNYLRDLSNQSKGKIFGQINQKFYFDKDDKAKSFANLTIDFKQLDGDEKLFSTKTDLNGNFEIDVPQGTYKISPILPDYAQLPDVEENYIDETIVEIKANGCQRVELTAENKSKISGKLLSSDGKPLKGIDVELIDFYTKEWATDGKTQEDGTFSIESVPAGKYILAVNKNLSPHAESPFPTYFYPNSYVQSAAQVFTIALGKSIENLIFQLPPKLKEQEISGVVVWTNGKPVVNARVEIDDTNDDSFFRSERFTKTDSLGKFKLKGFIGRSYVLKAEFKEYEKLSKEEAEKEMETTNKITMIMSGDNVEYARVTQGEFKTKPFKVTNKPIVFRIVLKEK